MSEWIEYKLGDVSSVQTGPFGSQLHQKDYVIVGTPIITVEHLGDNRITYQNLPKVSEEDKKRLNKYHLKVGDVVFSRVGSVDRRALVTSKEDGWLFSGRCLRVRGDEKKANGAFLSYYFGQESFKEYVRRIAVGATMPSINTKILSEIIVKIPDFSTQVSIVEILSCLDDKIELNNKINQELENLTQTLFKQWFIDFEFPNENGEPYKSSGGKMMDSELGEIPKGWKVKTLEDISNITIGRTPPRQEHEWFTTDKKDIKWISIRDMGNSGTYIHSTNEYLTEEAIKKFNVPIINTNTVIISFKFTVGRISITTERMLSNEAIAHINLIDDNLYPEFLYLFLKQFNFDSLGSTSSIATAVNSKSIKSLSFLYPSKEVLSEFNTLIVSLFSRIHDLTFENQEIINLRDELLPKLISGELKLK